MGPRRLVLAMSAAALTAVAAGAVLAFPLGDRLLDAAYDGTMPGVFRHLVDPARHDRVFYETTRATLFPGLAAGVIALWGLAVTLALRPGLRAVPRKYFRETSGPLDLAVFRILLFGWMLLTVRPARISSFADVPPELLRPPLGLGPVVERMPLAEPALLWSTRAFLVACAAAAVGLLTRLSAAAATILGLCVLIVPHLWGKVSHSNHHVIWFMALLATCRCGDALSVDAWVARRRGRPLPTEPCVAYALPLRFVWLLMGVVYLFPGLWKLFFGGGAWLRGENLISILHFRWFDIGGFEPLIPIDRHQWLLALGAIGVVVFEIAFIGLVMVRRARIPLAITGLLFHAGNMLFMRIPFASLMVCYASFIDWESLLARWRPVPPSPAPPPRTPRVTIALGVLLLAGNSALGILGLTQAWPLACYPRYFGPKPAHQEALVVTAVMDDGTGRAVPTTPLREHLNGAQWSLARRRMLELDDEATRHRKLAAIWAYLAGRADGLDRERVASVRFETERRPIDPAPREPAAVRTPVWTMTVR